MEICVPPEARPLAFAAAFKKLKNENCARDVSLLNGIEMLF